MPKNTFLLGTFYIDFTYKSFIFYKMMLQCDEIGDENEWH